MRGLKQLHKAVVYLSDRSGKSFLEKPLINK